MVSKADLHVLIEALPEALTEEAVRRLSELSDPVLVALLTAPEDDEPETDEERAAMAEVYADLETGEPDISHEEVRRELEL